MNLVVLSRKSAILLRPFFFQPWFYLALGVHAGLLWLPLAPDSKLAETPPEEDTIQVTQLPSSSDSDLSSEGNNSETETPSSALPKLQPLPPYTAPPSSPQKPSKARSEDVEVGMSVTTPTPAPSPSPTPQSENQPTPSSTPPKDNSTPAAHSTHDSNPFGENSGGQRGSRGDNTGNSGSTTEISDFFALFPRYSNAQAGSGGILRSEFENAAYLYNTSDNISGVVAYFDSELPNTSFTWEQTFEDGNFKVYKVTNTETSETKYLHLFSQDEKTVLYLEENNYTLAQLSEAEVRVVVDTVLTNIMTTAYINEIMLAEINDRNPVDSRNLFLGNAEEVKFYTTLTEIGSLSSFAEKIEQSVTETNPNFEFIKIGESQAGITYKFLEDNSFTYFTFVQGDDGQSVMIISPVNPFANT
ncbi:MAG: hypothetical protein SAJ12_11355 [Jaaginema sp. PMC 1079.18]|nr:hypothetical protein [Jaaginema sp. PMC 1080.18]MEC4851600.1 hypothetical protein [Jaaginema sp. PMC 1079.18]MEC4865065.1 hypothetical protein [Jaaginema sp. PMC 1078.18]